MERLPYFHLLHLFALFVLTAHTFMALANPDPANRKRTLIVTGVASLFVLGSGFGMLGIMKIPFSTGWVVVKLFCWLGLSALAGMAYRRAHLRGVLSFIALTLLLTAVTMVYFRPV